MDGPTPTRLPVLVVPVELDALCLSQPQPVVGPTADFTRLPYWDGERDVNPDIVNLGAEIRSAPFDGPRKTLAPGVHLHWAIPAALARGVAHGGDSQAASQSRPKLSFPPVPNRWLVTRRSGGQSVSWVVESDYVHPPASRVEGAISVPYFGAEGPPFRLLGRKRLVQEDWAEDQSAQYLAGRGSHLTAVGFARDPIGYAEPLFAASYPNCHSVFGFHDPDPPTHAEDTSYEVVGWFSEHEHDCIRDSALRDAPPGHYGDALRNTLGWRCPESAERPEATLLYGCVRLGAPPDGMRDPKDAASARSLAIGGSVAEVLAAHLSRPGAGGLTQREIEAHLRSAHLHGHRFDRDAKLDDVRHEHGFIAVNGGVCWQVRQEPAGSATDPTAKPASIPASVAEDLNTAVRLCDELNDTQNAFDRAKWALTSLAEQTYTDWVRYMSCAYPPPVSHNDFPDIDRARHFIQHNDLEPLERLDTTVDGLSDQATELRNDILAALQRFNQGAAAAGLTGLRYSLHRHSLPRFWRAKDPVLLIAGGIAKASARYPRRREPECCVVHIDDAWPRPQTLAAIDFAAALGDSATVPKQTEQPWDPLAIEWRVEVERPAVRDYAPGFVTSRYALADADFEAGAGPEEPTVKALYSGRSILSRHALEDLQLRVQSETGAVLERLSDRLREESEADVQTASLSGLNDALLMQARGLQVPIDDPLGTREARAFTAAVAKAVRNHFHSTPLPRQPFSPIRMGNLRLDALRVIDTFGRARDVRLEVLRLSIADSLAWRPDAVPLQVMAASGTASLPPRITQAARLNFRFLATGDAAPAGAHVRQNFVRGWIVPNPAERQFIVHDGTGRLLGAIRFGKESVWQSAPGASQVPLAQATGDAYLQGLLEALVDVAGDKDKRAALLARMDGLLDGILPEGADLYPRSALLPGRPLALVCVQVGLETKEAPRASADWADFKVELDRHEARQNAGIDEPLPRATHRHECVKWPVRFGRTGMLNDGLVGAWTGTAGYRPQADEIARDSPLLCEVAIEDRPITLALLIDPRASVHAACGAVPVKAIRIPPGECQQAMESLNTAFFCGPILTPQGIVALSLPAPAGYHWRAWVEKEKWEPCEVVPRPQADMLGKPIEVVNAWVVLSGRSHE